MTELCGALTSSMWQVRYVASLALLMSMAYFIFLYRGQYDANPTAVIFLHFTSFAGHFGAQCWVTFVAGLTMFYNLPRFYFGQVQARLFPLYFFSTFILSCVTFVTYSIHRPYDTWTSADTRQISALVVCVISTFVNTFFLAPELSITMVAVFELEKKHGTAFVVGHVDRSEMKQNPQYALCYRKFRRCHCFSAIANVITLLCNIMYLYHLACLCVHHSAKHCGTRVTW